MNPECGKSQLTLKYLHTNLALQEHQILWGLLPSKTKLDLHWCNVCHRGEAVLWHSFIGRIKAEIL